MKLFFLKGKFCFNKWNNACILHKNLTNILRVSENELVCFVKFVLFADFFFFVKRKLRSLFHVIYYRWGWIGNDTYFKTNFMEVVQFPFKMMENFINRFYKNLKFQLFSETFHNKFKVEKYAYVLLYNIWKHINLSNMKQN